MTTTHDTRDTDKAREMADVIGDAAQRPETTRAGLNALAGEVIAAIVRLIVSVVGGPLRQMVLLQINERFHSERKTLGVSIRQELRRDPAFLAELKAGIRGLVAKEVSLQKAEWKAEVLAEIAAGNHQVIYRESRRAYPFALLFTFIGGLLGALGGWLLTTRFESARLIAETGQSWSATTIADDPLFAGVFIGVSACLIAAIGAVIGFAIDTVRDRQIVS